MRRDEIGRTPVFRIDFIARLVKGAQPFETARGAGSGGMADLPVAATGFAIAEGHDVIDVGLGGVFGFDGTAAAARGAVGFVEGEEVSGRFRQAFDDLLCLRCLCCVDTVDHGNELQTTVRGDQVGVWVWTPVVVPR
jgi:hypothetical protein